MKRQSIETVRSKTSFFKTIKNKRETSQIREMKVDHLYKDVCRLKTTMMLTVPYVKEQLRGVQIGETEVYRIPIENGQGRMREPMGNYSEVKRLDIMQEEILGVSDTI